MNKHLALITATTVTLLTTSAFADTKQYKKLEAEVAALQKQVTLLQAQSSSRGHHPLAKEHASGHLKPVVSGKHFFGPKRFLEGVTVTTSPWLQEISSFDASDLLYMVSSMNEDMTLLQQRQTLERQLNKYGDSLDNRALIELSGGLEGDYIYTRGFSGSSSGDIALGTAELDVVPMVSSWASGLFSIDYDSSPVSTGSRDPSRKLYLKRGFLTIGNLDKSPIYFSIGEMYAPFGRYSSAMLTSSLTLSMMRVLTPVARLGFYKNGFYGSIYGFNGDQTNSSSNMLRQGGLNFGYKHKTSFGSIESGVGYITNIADSQGMQNNGLSDTFPTTFTGFAGNRNGVTTQKGNTLAHAVGGADAHVELGIGNWYLVAEGLMATNGFAPQDMLFQNHGAHPAAMHTEADYSFHWLGKPWIAGVAYGHTWQGLALNLPEDSYWASLQVSIWKDTVEGIEYRHDTNYRIQGASTVGGAQNNVQAANIGGSRNMVTAQVGIYF